MSLLQELREQGVDLPYGCQYGGCITCAAKLIEGEIDQRSQVALNNRQINNGYIILCVARPKQIVLLKLELKVMINFIEILFLTHLHRMS
jgi:ferredoxin